MSITSKFAYTNKDFFNETQSGFKVAKLGVKANYALTMDEPDQCALSNKTTPVDQDERLVFGCRPIKTVSSGVDNIHPAPTSSAIQYQVKAEELLSTTSDTDPNFRVDEPIVFTLTIRHPKTGSISNAIIKEGLQRLIGACYNDDGTLRFEELMKSALRPE